MGGIGSKPQVHHHTNVYYHDNSAEINQNLDIIRNQINEINGCLSNHKKENEVFVESIQQRFNHFDQKVMALRYVFETFFENVNMGIKTIKYDISEMSKLQIEYEKRNQEQQWLMIQNDWKENFERITFQELQQLQNMKISLELDLHQKIGSYLLLKDGFNDKIQHYHQLKMEFMISNLQNKLEYLSEHKEIVSYEQKENTELEILKTQIVFPPELDEGIKNMFLMSKHFQEIAETEQKLLSYVEDVKTHYANPALLNPLDYDTVKPWIFAKKIYENTGVRSIKEIVISNQTKLLPMNGYAYVPEYKYEALVQKFIEGCDVNMYILEETFDDLKTLKKLLRLNSDDKIHSITHDLLYLKKLFPKKMKEIGDEFQFGLTLLKTSPHFHYYELKYDGLSYMYECLTSERIIDNFGWVICNNFDIATFNNDILNTLHYNSVGEFALQAIRRWLVDNDTKKMCVTHLSIY